MGDERSRLVAELAEIVGPGHVLCDAGMRASFERDWTGRFGGGARAVVRPGSAGEAASVLAACSRDGTPVVPQGGNTGLVGGGVPRGGEIVLSTRRLSWLGEVDTGACELSTGAGATLGAARDMARRGGLDLGVDFAARDSATVGGAIATNAGGMRVLRFGPMRSQLAGIEVALSSGERVGRLVVPAKESLGVHLPSLFAGSEGTLGVITAARLRLVPRFPAVATALVGLASLADAETLVGLARRELADLDQLELMLHDGLELVCSSTGVAPPFGARRHAAYLLVESAGFSDPLDALAGCLESAPGVAEVAVAVTPAQREQLRALRERHTEAIGTLGVPLKLDVAVPLGSLADVCAEIAKAVATASPRTRLVLFGHAAEANLHVNLVGPREDEEMLTEVVLGIVVAAGGTVSAEHGIGIAKVGYLHLVRSPAELAVLAGLRRLLDPAGVLNPGVLDPGVLDPGVLDAGGSDQVLPASERR